MGDFFFAKVTLNYSIDCETTESLNGSKIDMNKKHKNILLCKQCSTTWNFDHFSFPSSRHVFLLMRRFKIRIVEIALMKERRTVAKVDHDCSLWWLSDLSNTVCVYVNKLFLVDGLFTWVLFFPGMFLWVCVMMIIMLCWFIWIPMHAMLNVSFCWITYQSGVI